ncbi:MAG: recombinase family protein [Actinomyces sp. oral taxon 181]|nr:recombinase family protein [Actinomyces sp. oral taxon 181]
MSPDFKTITPRRTPTSRIRVAAYCRVSTMSETQAGSLAAQVSAYSKLICSNPAWQFAGIYTDQGISGTTSNRPGFAEMMDHARAGDFQILLVKSISRLARNTVDLLSCVRELATLGVAVRFERENIDTSSAEGELMLTLLASFAQEESRSLSQNVKWAIRNRYKAGRTNSHRIYGYTWVGGSLHINDDEAQVVRRVFDEYLAGVSPEAIADRLNAEGLRARGGGNFLGSVIRTWLENPRYVGNEMLQATYTDGPGGKLVVNDGALPKYWVEGANPPIIDQGTWKRVQDELARRRQSGGRALTPSGGTCALTHRVVCSQCGRRFHRRTKTRKHISYKYWWCETATRGQGNPCRAPQIREAQLKCAITTHLGLGEWDDQQVLDRLEQVTVYPSGKVTVTKRGAHTAEPVMAGKE